MDMGDVLIFSWLMFLFGLMLGDIIGKRTGYKEAHEDFCRNQAAFYKYCMKDEYIGFLKKYDIPMTKAMKECLSEDVNVFEKHRLINEFREKCIKSCEREGMKQ